MLGWSRAELAKESGVAERTIIDFERGARKTYERTLRDMQEAFEAAGVEFIDRGEGSRGILLRHNYRR